MKAIIYLIKDGVMVELWDIKLILKVQSLNVIIKALRMLRSETLGPCNHFNQVTVELVINATLCAMKSWWISVTRFKSFPLIIFNVINI